MNEEELKKVNGGEAQVNSCRPDYTLSAQSNGGIDLNGDEVVTGMFDIPEPPGL